MSPDDEEALEPDFDRFGPSPDSPDYQPPPKTSLGDAIAFLEFGVGLIVICCVLFVVAVVGLVVLVNAALGGAYFFKRSWYPIAWVLWPIVVPLLVASVRLYFRGFEIASSNLTMSLPVATAMNQPRYPLVLRPFAAAWWLFNIAIVFWLTDSLIDHYFENGHGLKALGWTIQYCFIFFALFGTSFVTNSYLANAVAAIYRSEPVLRWLYRFRFVLDLMLTIVIFLSSRSQH